MSLFRKILLFARSAGISVGGGEASEVGGAPEGWGATHSVGGGVATWTFAGPRGGVAQGLGGKACAVGGVGV